MKHFVILAALISSTVFADGIPTPIRDRSQHIWDCANGATVYLLTASGRFQVGVENGADILAGVSGSMANLLVLKGFKYLDGKSYTSTYGSRTRTVTFGFKAPKFLSVTMQDAGETYQHQAIDCIAQF